MSHQLPRPSSLWSAAVLQYKLYCYNDNQWWARSNVFLLQKNIWLSGCLQTHTSCECLRGHDIQDSSTIMTWSRDGSGVEYVTEPFLWLRFFLCRGLMLCILLKAPDRHLAMKSEIWSRVKINEWCLLYKIFWEYYASLVFSFQGNVYNAQDMTPLFCKTSVQITSKSCWRSDMMFTVSASRQF